MNCPNCGKALKCGCEKRVASDGKQVCTSCMPAYEINLNKPKAQAAVNDFVPVLNDNSDQVDPVVNGLEIKYNNFQS